MKPIGPISTLKFFPKKKKKKIIIFTFLTVDQKQSQE